MAEDVRRGRGRPRDDGIDARVVAATLELLASQGFLGTTIQAISRRSKVHSSAIYRRWPTRIELIEEAVFPGLDTVSIRPTGDLRNDLRRFVRAYLKTLGSPAARAAIPELLGSYQAGGRTRSGEQWLGISARPQFQDILRAAPVGTVDSEIDPDDVFDMMLGAILAHLLVPPVSTRTRFVERSADLLLRLLRPVGSTEAVAEMGREAETVAGEPTR